MVARLIRTTAFLVLGFAPAAFAQGEPPEPAAPVAREARYAVDVSRLPVNIQRIHRQLRQTTISEERDGLNLRYIVEVYGQAPRIDILTPADNLRHGPVPYGGPTHAQMLEVMTPQEFRSPVMDFGALMRWLSDRSKK